MYIQVSFEKKSVITRTKSCWNVSNSCQSPKVCKEKTRTKQIETKQMVLYRTTDHLILSNFASFLPILHITNTMSLALQRKDQHIVNAMNCVTPTRTTLVDLRWNGWGVVLCDVQAFFVWNIMLEIEEVYWIPIRNEKLPKSATNITIKLIVSIMVLIG